MNEKTKKIISYIGCALGGMSLGIALLGGLSYCSTANKAKTESVNTILTKKNERIITESGYNGYSFSLETNFPTTTDGYSYKIYGFEDNTYTPVTYSSSSGTLGGHNRGSVVTMINTAYEQARQYQVSNRRYHFLLAFFAFSNPWENNTANNYPITYLTFIEPAYNGYENGYSNANTAFVLTGEVPWNLTMSINSNSIASWGASAFYTLTNSRQSFFCFKHIENDTTNHTLVFQDVVSYYKELGYQQGYGDGERTGYNSGYEVGYSDGSETGRMFTALGLNQTTWYKSDLTPTSTSETSNFYKLLEFKDGDNEEWGVAAELFTTNDLFKVDLYKNINQGYTSATYYGTLGEGTMTYVNGVWQVEMTPATYYFYEWAQITEVYNNSLPLNYFLLTGTPQNATGYQQGYQAGYQEGILATPGGEATNNVFSLFTSAFDSVGGFFNLKIFGFLPLYWFFLAPLFVALITLLLRMVKH